MAQVIACPACNGALSTKALSCPHCGHVIRATGGQKLGGCLWPLFTLLVIVPLIVVGGTCAIVGLMAAFETPAPLVQPGIEEDAAEPARDPRRGEIGRLRLPGVSAESLVHVAADPAAHREALDLSLAGDLIGLANMERAGRLMIVPPGTRVRVIESGMLRKRVRIEEGRFRGRDGWVAAEFVGPE